MVLGGFLVYFNGFVSFLFGVFIIVLIVFVFFFVCKYFLGCFNVLWRYVVIVVCCLVFVFFFLWRVFFGKLWGICRNFFELIENVVFMILLSYIIFCELFNEVVWCYV